MKIALNILMIIALYILGLSVASYYQASGMDNMVKVGLTIDMVNGGDEAQVLRKSYDYLGSIGHTVWTLFCGLLIAWQATKGLSKNSAGCGLLLLAVVFIPSCRRPYQVPVYVTVQNNETAFVIPLEGSTDKQAQLNSAKFLEEKKVSQKRIEIPMRWNQTGRRDYMGEWIPAVNVIKVDRAPVTRNWETKGGGSTKDKDEAIWVESADSVGFSMGFNCTAFIKEEDTATFLYWYASGSLDTVMDTEIRGRIQQVASRESARYPLDDLRGRKNETSQAVNDDIIPFFAKRGITITTVSIFGGMTYENPEIQKAIDNVFVAQQKKNVAQASFDAQNKLNETMILEATGTAEQRRLQAEGEAKAIESLTRAVANGGQNYLALKALEVQVKQIEKWDGRLPTFQGTGGTPLLNIDHLVK